MRCQKCKKEVPDGSNFCQNCGAKTATDSSIKSRGNGQGTAIKRGKTWTAVWTEGHYIGDDDKLHWRRKWKGGFKSKTAALAYASAPPESAPRESPTLRDYWNGWSKSELLDLSKSKQGAYKRAWKRLQSLADKAMSDISISDIQECIDKNGKTYYPARDMKSVLSHCYKRAVAEGSARTNLSEFIRLPKLDEKELQPFEESEIYNLWKAYGEGNEFIGYILVMIYTGMMPGELLQLEFDMINFDKHEIIGCGLKTKKRKETPIVFPEMIAPVLLTLCGECEAHSRIVNTRRDKFYDDYHDALKSANVRELPPYSCRHTTATALALGNIAPSVIQEVMRHTKFSTTQRYIHPDVQSAREAVESIGTGKKTEK